MAEVRQCFGSGAHGFARKIYSRYLLEGRNKHERGAIHASSLSIGFLLGDIESVGLYRVQNGADGVTVGTSQGSYTRLKPALGAAEDVWKTGNFLDNYYFYPRREKYPLSINTQLQINERSVFLHRRYDASLRTLRQQQRPRHLCADYGQLVFIRAYSGNDRSVPLYKTKDGYYEILEVASTATQAQIKTAYYKQSFIYHPDRNSGSEEASVRFSEVSEAYTVLGNMGLRKKYDRGLLSLSDLNTTVRPSGKDPAGGSPRSHAERKRPAVGADGRESVFDFDQFFKGHYGEQLHRQQNIRMRRQEMLKEKHEEIGDKKLGKLMEVSGVVLIVAAMVVVMNFK
ncbi:dnaJ homolog subfamily C member 30, mitochondrial-like [Mugil cephalus]|uniref:dnaJ homolog subfamily C member 30, mitochondrial-like n=1 Tax=Mugil cephalus TaxID=48193 RepID=UPI001FB697B0|nr:dnaJ homolog subfamily C member 30, mitochondrial-like [Mugil cephalus]